MNINVDKKSPLQLIREKKKISLRKLSEITGLSNSYLSKLERGTERLHSENLPILSKALGVSMGYLLGESELKDEYIYLLWYENIHVFADDNQEEELRPWGILKEFLKNTFPAKDIEKLILIRMKGDSMSPEIKAEDIVICCKIENDVKFQFLHGVYIFKYEENVFIRKLSFNKEKNIINAVAENTKYPSFEIDLSKQKFQVMGEILSIVSQISTL